MYYSILRIVNTIDNIDEFFSVLVKLRLNLANRMGCSKATISCVTQMVGHYVLHPKTPDCVARHRHFAAKLAVFSEALPRVKCIIDCFEV